MFLMLNLKVKQWEGGNSHVVCFDVLKSDKVRNLSYCPGSVSDINILKLFCQSLFDFSGRRVIGPQQSGGSVQRALPH